MGWHAKGRMQLFKKFHPEIQLRLIGLIVLFLTAVGGYAGIVDPLLDARRHERFITWYPEAAAIIPIGSIMGLLFLILGARAEGVLQFLGRSRAAGIAVAVLLAVLAVAAFIIADQYFRSLGYS